MPLILPKSVRGNGSGFSRLASGILNGKIGGGGAPPEPTFDYGFNVYDHHERILLSNENRTVTHDSEVTAWVSARGADGHSSGRHYFESTFIEFSGSYIAVGIGQWDAPLDNYVGATTKSVGLVSDGSVFIDGVPLAVTAAVSEGDIVRVAVNFFLKKIWFAVNGGAWNSLLVGTQNPETEEGGISYHSDLSAANVMASLQKAGDSLSVNFGYDNEVFAYALPASYQVWSEPSNIA